MHQCINYVRKVFSITTHNTFDIQKSQPFIETKTSVLELLFASDAVIFSEVSKLTEKTENRTVDKRIDKSSAQFNCCL